MILPGGTVVGVSASFHGSAGVLQGIFQLGDLSQVSDKARNAIETSLGSRPKASGHYLKIRVY